ncbi:MAG: hypothetical protein WBD40_08015 [Tepidisphaeraceae bacterium]
MKRWTPLLSALLTVAFATAAMACPNCKDSIPTAADGSSTGGLPSGFNTSIYVMLLGLFAVIGMVAFTIVKGVRSSQWHGLPARGACTHAHQRS